MSIAFHRSDPVRHFFFAACAVVVLLHVRSFTLDHEEGDELAYRALAQEMNWDLSHYTTKDAPRISSFPFSIYQQDLFHQPPLFPLILKVGDAIGAPVALGLAVQLLAMGLLLGFARRFVLFFGLDREGECEPILYALIASCPLLLFSTTRLHHDGLMAILLLCGLVAYVEALETRSARRALGAGLLLVAALNTRYNAIAVLPLLPLAQLLALWRRGRDEQRLLPSDWAAPRHWRVFAIVAALVATFGMQHYYRILLEYGTLLPSGIIQPGDAGWNRFTAVVAARTRPQVLGILLLIFPMWALPFLPSSIAILRRHWTERSWALFFVFAWLVWVVATFSSAFQQLRYFAGAALLGSFTMVLLLGAHRGTQRTVARYLVGASLFLMLATALLAAVTRVKAVIVPAPVALLPFLEPFYR